MHFQKTLLFAITASLLTSMSLAADTVERSGIALAGRAVGATDDVTLVEMRRALGPFDDELNSPGAEPRSEKHRKKHRKNKKNGKKNHNRKHKKHRKNTAQKNVNQGVASKAQKGLLAESFGGQCPNPGASDKYPNGNINFLNCGISKSNPNGAWSPPGVKLSQLRFVSSDEASQSGVFGACSKYKGIFDSAANAQGVPAVLLMAFAMQESSCNPGVHGGNGEIGMMQLTPDKCNGVNCWDPSTNVHKGAKYFKDTLDQMNGNVLQAIGQYNGWQKGMTYNRATSQQWGCHAQNNLDYLNQMLNGWILGKNGHSLTVYNNLAKCGS